MKIKSMKVLLINAVYGTGSTGQIIRDIQNMCFKHSIECYVAYSTAACPVPNGYQIGHYLPKKVHALLSRITGKQAYFSKHATKKFLNYLDELAPDVVHLHNLHSNYINLNMVLEYLAQKDIPTIVTNHDCWYYTGGCFHYTANNCNKWKENCGDCQFKKGFSSLILDKSAEVLADRKKYFSAIPRLFVTGVSLWSTYEAKDTVFNGRKMYPILNGVDLDIFKPMPVGTKYKQLASGKKIILGPASKWLLPINQDALHYFCRNMPDDTILLLFGCRGNKSISHPKIITIPHTSNKQELAELYSMADVMVNCTREETLSLINIEAQACGTPVITYDGTGVQETVDGVLSRKVSTGDYKALFTTVFEVLGKDISSTQCRNWVEQKFNLQANYTKYIELYRSILQK